MSTVVVEEPGRAGSQRAQGLILTADDTHLCSTLNTVSVAGFEMVEWKTAITNKNIVDV